MIDGWSIGEEFDYAIFDKTSDRMIGSFGLHTVDDVLASVREIFPEEQPPERLRLLREDIFLDKG